MDIHMTNIFFPNELIVEILLRLPVKSLVRFKTACKPWHSLISNPSFTNSHFDLAVTPTNKLLCITPSSFEGQVIDVDTSILRPCTLIRLPRPYHFSFEIMGSCRGFILFVNYPHLIIWNPSTGVHKSLSFSRTASNAFTSEATIPIHFWCGFGYDTCNDDYLVVMGWHEVVGLKTHVEFFSLRTNLWEEIEGIHFPYLICFVGSGSGVFLNGAIHWLATHRGRPDQENGLLNNVIIAFDLVGKNFLEISLPHKIRGFFYYLKVLGERLGVCHAQGNEVEIWVMKEYNVQSSWTKLNVAFSYCIRRGTPLCFTKDEKLVAINGCGHLVKFNDMGKYAESQPYEHDMRMMVMFSETLLSLP